MDGGTEGRGSKDIRPIAECRLTIENWATSLSSSISFNSDDGVETDCRRVAPHAPYVILCM